MKPINLTLTDDETLFLTSDHHFGDERQSLMHRPFADAAENYEAMRDRHNEVVRPQDLVIFNGDIVSLLAKPKEEWLDAISAFNGRLWLVRGNHDINWTVDELNPYFEKIIPHGDGIELDVSVKEIRKLPKRLSNIKPLPVDLETLHLYITHYPTQSRVDRFNIVGHIHEAWRYQKNMLNVGVDVNHFYPFHIHEVAFYLNAINEFYDDDVWVANHKANLPYADRRGKKGSRFDTFAKE